MSFSHAKLMQEKQRTDGYRETSFPAQERENMHDFQTYWHKTRPSKEGRITDIGYLVEAEVEQNEKMIANRESKTG